MGDDQDLGALFQLPHQTYEALKVDVVEGSFDLVRQAADAERQAAMLKPLVKELDEAPFAGQRPALPVRTTGSDVLGGGSRAPRR